MDVDGFLVSIPIVLILWRVTFEVLRSDFGSEKVGPRGLRLGVKKGVAREGEDDLRVIRWNNVDLVVECRKNLEKILEKIRRGAKRVRVFTRQLTSGR